MLENGWWGGMHPHILSGSALPALITMPLTTTPTSRFRFSMIRGKWCFEITARSAFAQFGHFTLKTRIRFQKGGKGRPSNFSLGALLIFTGVIKSIDIFQHINKKILITRVLAIALTTTFTQKNF